MVVLVGEEVPQEDGQLRLKVVGSLKEGGVAKGALDGVGEVVFEDQATLVRKLVEDDTLFVQGHDGFVVPDVSLDPHDISLFDVFGHFEFLECEEFGDEFACGDNLVFLLDGKVNFG